MLGGAGGEDQVGASVRDDPEKEELREVLVAVGQQYVGGLGRDYHISVCH
jgi:hypothetical protein